MVKYYKLRISVSVVAHDAMVIEVAVSHADLRLFDDIKQFQFESFLEDFFD